MKLLLDEHISPRLAEAMRRDGHDVVAVAERFDLVGSDDASILAAAAAERRVLVTEDVRDFARLGAGRLSNKQAHFGVVLLPRRARQGSASGSGSLVQGLTALLRSHPADDELVELVIWLQP